MDKLIKKSNRGLTFSFPSSGKLSIGSRYDYIISKDQQSIRICAAQNGRYKLSRKRRGETWYSLVDLRNKEVLDGCRPREGCGLHQQNCTTRISIFCGTLQPATVL